jgi:hypothetical protein
MALDGIRKLHSTTACSGGVVSLLCNLSGGHTRGIEREVERGGEPGREERRHVANCVVLSISGCVNLLIVVMAISHMQLLQFSCDMISCTRISVRVGVNSIGSISGASRFF